MFVNMFGLICLHLNKYTQQNTNLISEFIVVPAVPLVSGKLDLLWIGVVEGNSHYQPSGVTDYILMRAVEDLKCNKNVFFF